MFFENNLTKDLSRAKKYFEDIISYTVGPYSLNDMIEHRISEMNILDVRDYDDYSNGHIPFAVHIPHKELKDRTDLINKNNITVVYTYSDTCPRAYKAALTLVENQRPAIVLRGGFKQWKKFDFDIVKTDSSSGSSGE